MSRADGWYFVRIDDEWRPAEWLDGDWDLSPMMALLILEVDEDPISIAIHAENRQLRAKLAELEAQAAIGRRAVEIVDQALPVWDGDGIDPERHHCELTLLNERHRARAEIFGRLRDAEQAEPEPDTVQTGWKLVPVEPTREMLEKTSWQGCAATDYKHMLAAAPTPPADCWQGGEPATVAVDAGALAELLEQAAEDIQEWGAYASAYFQEKHNLAANVAKYREAARRLLEAA